MDAIAEARRAEWIQALRAAYRQKAQTALQAFYRPADDCACDNCDWQGPAASAEPCRDFWSRVSPGAMAPAGDCPECGAFVYPVTALAPNRITLVVESGVVQAVYADRPEDIRVWVMDYDVTAAEVTVAVAQPDGGTAPAGVGELPVSRPDALVETLYRVLADKAVSAPPP